MKIKEKTLMINVEHNISVGSNNAIEATVIHQVCLYDHKGVVQTDVDLMDIVDIKFLGVSVEDGYKSFNKFKAQMLELGIDVNSLIDEECVGIINPHDLRVLTGKYISIFNYFMW
tara:strand:- start:1910 stop:2254 length:345 start_codon:yes stop_codon:yes gene_type:complete